MNNHSSLKLPASGGFDQHRVMVIEDNELQRAVLVAGLRSLGVGYIAEAVNGNIAVELLTMDEQGFDTILCDLQMEDSNAMDGIEFIRESRAFQFGSLILISSLDEDLFASAEMLAFGYGLPLIGRLHKPVNLANLRELLLRHPRRQASDKERPRTVSTLHTWTRNDLTQALKRGEFIPHFQPKVSLANGELDGVEALARWHHPGAGVLPPSQFIELMEREGLIDQLTDQLYRQLLISIRKWSDEGLQVKVAFNASSLTLQDIEIPNRWRAIADEHRVSTGLLTVELTESAIAQKFHGLLESLTRLRMHGFGVSLDDFGTGYASMQQLCDMPVTEVKIDRSFVASAASRPRTGLVMDAMISLAKRLDLKVVAEGVETLADVDFVRSAGCDTAQGYYYSRAMPGEVLAPWVSASGRTPGAALASPL